MNPSIDMPLDRLVHSIATGPDAVSGLTAMARELGGRRGRRLSELASQIERGKIDPGDQAKRAADFPPRSIGVVQSAEHLPRWIMLEELRDQSSSRLQAVVWFSFAYLLSASAIGLALLQVITPLAPKMDFNWTGRTFEEVPLQPIKIAYEVLVVLLLVSTLIWTMHLVLRSSRQRSGVIARIDYAFDWVVSQIPWIGSARVAVELARISEAIHQSLVSQWTYPAALRAAAVQTDSAMLRAWLTAGSLAHRDRRNGRQEDSIHPKTLPRSAPTNRHLKSAFTLVELLVVIAIIGELLGLMLSATQSMRGMARRSQYQNNLLTLSLALSAYHEQEKGKGVVSRVVFWYDRGFELDTPFE